MKGGVAEIRFEGLAQPLAGKVANLTKTGVDIDCDGFNLEQTPGEGSLAEVAFFGQDSIFLANVRRAGEEGGSLSFEFTAPVRKIRMRTAQRYPCCMKAELNGVACGTPVSRWYDVEIKDIGSRGVLVVASQKFPVGAPIQLRFALHPSGTEICGPATIVNTRGAGDSGWAYGCAFGKFTP